MGSNAEAPHELPRRQAPSRLARRFKPRICTLMHRPRAVVAMLCVHERESAQTGSKVEANDSFTSERLGSCIPAGAFPRSTRNRYLGRSAVGSTVECTRDASLPRAHRRGDVIASKYVLEEMIGQGGMGTVWVARNLTLDVRVALKVLLPGLETTAAANRLLEEARAEAKLEHPAIVRVFDSGKTGDGNPFIVMELLDGRSLGDLLRQRRRLTAQAAVQILLPVLDALVTAHERGIVHRDLTPENIFLAREARRIQPKIVDFGIALLEKRAPNRITQNGTIVGCPQYMSPEQATGEKLDHRTDLWTVCVVLYEAICGRPPFTGDNYAVVLRSIVADAPVPITDLGIADRALWQVIEKGLSKQPDSRWSSAGALGRALAEWLSSNGVREDICGASIGELWLSETKWDARRDIFGDVLPLLRARVPGGKAAGRQDTPLPAARESDAGPIENPSDAAVPDRDDGVRTVRLNARPVLPMALSAIAGFGVLLSAVLALGHAFDRPSEPAATPKSEGLMTTRIPLANVPQPAEPSAIVTPPESAVPERTSGPLSRVENAPSASHSSAPEKKAPARVPQRRRNASIATPLPPSGPLDLKEPY